jgi:hypothetical protein
MEVLGASSLMTESIEVVKLNVERSEASYCSRECRVSLERVKERLGGFPFGKGNRHRIVVERPPTQREPPARDVEGGTSFSSGLAAANKVEDEVLSFLRDVESGCSFHDGLALGAVER